MVRAGALKRVNTGWSPKGAHMSLRVQIAMLVSIAVLVSYGLMFTVSIVSDRAQTLEKSDSGLKLLALYMAGQLSARLENISGKADQLAVQVGEKPPTYSKEAYDLLERYYGLTSEIHGGVIAFDEYKFTPHQRQFGLYLAREGSGGSFTRGRMGPVYDYLNPLDTRNNWFTLPKQTGRAVWTLPYFDTGGAEKWVLSYSAPFSGKDGFLGVVSVDLPFEAPGRWMADVIENTPRDVRNNGWLLVTDGAGTLVSYTDTAMVEEGENISRLLRLDDSADDDGDWRDVRRAEWLQDSGGTGVRVARVPIGKTGWFLYAVTEEAVSLAEFYSRLYRSLVWALVSLAVFILVLRLFTARLTAPLIQASAFATRLRDGHLEERMEAPRQLECARLVAALNDMAETIDRRTCENERSALQRESMFRQVTVAAEELTHIALDIHAKSGEGVRDANDQQADFRHFADVLSGFHDHTNRAAETAGRADRLLREARERAERGNVEMGELSRAMGDLVGSTNEISKILKSINDIAFQTNLLSLNAAVEAAHAGRSGKGFGVVAEEVRRLAIRSAKAADETNARLTESERRAADGITASRMTSEALEGIRSVTEDVALLMSELTRLFQQQAELVDQVLGGLGRVEQIASENHARAVSEASASEQLRMTAETLREMLLPGIGEPGTRLLPDGNDDE